MTRQASSLLVSTGLFVLTLAFSTSNTQAADAPPISPATPLDEATAAADRVVLERRFEATRGTCTDVGVPTNRVFPDGTRELFIVPAGKVFVLTDLEGEITEKYNAAWSAGAIGMLTATLTGTVANQAVRARTPIDANALSARIATVKLHLQSGAVADAGAAVCLTGVVITKMSVVTADVGADVRVYGYLIEP